MKKTTKVISCTIIWLIIVAIIVVCAHYAFEHFSVVRSLFGASSNDAVLGEVAPTSPAALSNQAKSAAQMSMYLFLGITLLQVFAFVVAANVFKSIKKSEFAIDVKLKQLDNADIFLDVPLYLGLFGTVSAFLVMTFSPTSSRFIAYSSTIIGIIFSLVLRLTLNYPIRRSFISEKAESEK